jgi:hypothetical protein
MEASMVRSLTNGGGKSTMTLGLCQYLSRTPQIHNSYLLARWFRAHRIEHAGTAHGVRRSERGCSNITDY